MKTQSNFYVENYHLNYHWIIWLKMLIKFNVRNVMTRYFSKSGGKLLTFHWICFWNNLSIQWKIENQFEY
jgi:hypothetical protein